MKIIPAINCKDYETALSRIKLADKFLRSDYRWIHIDIVDGEFAPTSTWGTPEELKKIHSQFPDINFEIHLMVKNPEVVAESWLASGAKRVIVHIESVHNIEKCRLIAHRHNDAEIMLSGGVDVSAEQLFEEGKYIKAFQVLAVNPGFAGQKFDEKAVDKIAKLRELAPDARIEIDGGVNFETIKLAKNAGADIAVSASTIFKSDNPAEAYERLVNSD